MNHHAFFAWIVEDRKLLSLKKKKVGRIISKCKFNDDADMVGIYKHIHFLFLLFLMKKIIVIYL